MKILLPTLIFVLTFAHSASAQSGFEQWDKNYRQVNIEEILQFEQRYADSIDATTGKSSYYMRTAKYRFDATYLGQSRTILPQVMGSMKNVFKLSGGEVSLLDQSIKTEYLFQVGPYQVWAPIQKQLEKPFKKEVRPGESVLLYCLFLNEHSSNGLFNTFLVSEFMSQ